MTSWVYYSTLQVPLVSATGYINKVGITNDVDQRMGFYEFELPQVHKTFEYDTRREALDFENFLKSELPKKYTLVPGHTEYFYGNSTDFLKDVMNLHKIFSHQVDPTKYIGTTIRKKFGERWYKGIVTKYRNSYWGVEYEDGDEEDMSEDEVLKSRVLVRRSTRQNNINIIQDGV
jgi:hypothetical protein